MIKCHYCGKLSTYSEFVLDMIDPNKGLGAGNIVWCCKHCKQMKAGYNKEQFLEQIKKIYKLYFGA